MDSLTNHFLIAMPGLADPNFHQTVTLICQHDENGALGIVINRPTDLAIRDVLEQMGIPAGGARCAGEPVFGGGPVQVERGFILHDVSGGGWDATLSVGEGLGLTSSRDILEAMADNRGPGHYLVALGYAGWAAGQLEHEISNNAWLNGPADPDIIFRVPVEARWRRAAELLGVDLRLLSSEAGHA
jgi:putative transcriptional regulator